MSWVGGLPRILVQMVPSAHVRMVSDGPMSWAEGRVVVGAGGAQAAGRRSMRPSQEHVVSCNCTGTGPGSGVGTNPSVLVLGLVLVLVL